MATFEARTANLEGQMQQLSQVFSALWEDFAEFRRHVETRFDRMEARIDRVDARIDRLDDRMSRQFLWLVGIQITSLIAMLGALLAQR